VLLALTVSGHYCPSILIFFICYLFLLILFLIITTITGTETFHDDELTVANFFLLRINDHFEVASDLDSMNLNFSVSGRHFSCLPPKALSSIVKYAGNGTIFNFPVYFHPNVRTDGWREIVERYQRIRAIHPDLPPLPTQPKFWQHPIRGSAIHLWPPSFFDVWIDMVQSGISLSLDPSAGAIAGPLSPCLSSPLSSLSSLSPLSSPLPESPPPESPPPESPPPESPPPESPSLEFPYSPSPSHQSPPLEFPLSPASPSSSHSPAGDARQIPVLSPSDAQCPMSVKLTDTVSLQVKKEMLENNQPLETLKIGPFHPNAQLEVDGFEFVNPPQRSPSLDPCSASAGIQSTHPLCSPPATSPAPLQPQDTDRAEEEDLWEGMDNFLLEQGTELDG
jgi:hypothetical protein